MNWETNDGREIPIKELENNHLVNILRMLHRYAVRDMLMDGGDDWQNYLEDKKMFKALEKEAKSRAIKWKLASREQLGIEQALRDYLILSGTIDSGDVVDAAWYLATVLRKGD